MAFISYRSFDHDDSFIDITAGPHILNYTTGHTNLCFVEGNNVVYKSPNGNLDITTLTCQ